MDISAWSEGYIIGNSDPQSKLFKPSVDYLEKYDVWSMCRDANEGASCIKSKGVKYLPPLDSHLTGGIVEGYRNGRIGDILKSGGIGTDSPKRNAYDDYKNRAVWYGAVGLTVDAFVNMVYRKAPAFNWKSTTSGEATFPEKSFLDGFYSNVSSYREDMNSFLQRLTEEILVTNYVGVLEDAVSGAKKSYSVLYRAEQIIRVQYTVDAEGFVIPECYVLKECNDEDDILYRVLVIDTDGEYNQAVFTPVDGGGFEILSLTKPTYYPTKDTRQPVAFTKIPFWIFSMRGKKVRGIPTPRIHDLAEMALGYYRNSADRENEQHTVSIKTAIFPGWNVDEYGDPALGGALACPPDCKPFIMEAKTESQLKEAMAEKVENCARLGSNILTGRGKYLQAKETAEINVGGDTSTVEAMSLALESTFNEVMKLKLQWMRNYDEEVSLSLNTQYFSTGLDANYFASLVKGLQSNAMSFEAFFHIMDNANMYPDGWTMDKERKAIENNPIPDFTDAVMDTSNDLGTQL